MCAFITSDRVNSSWNCHGRRFAHSIWLYTTWHPCFTVILLLRTYALWNNNRKILISLIVLYIVRLPVIASQLPLQPCIVNIYTCCCCACHLSAFSEAYVSYKPHRNFKFILTISFRYSTTITDNPWVLPSSWQQYTLRRFFTSHVVRVKYVSSTDFINWQR